MKTEKEIPSIIINRIRTPDGTILTSRHVHDYVEHTDEITGGYFAVDGGKEYAKRCFDGHYDELSVYDDAPFELIRYVFEWGSRGVKGDEPLQYKILQCMSDNHIKAILETQTHISEQIRNIFIKEQKYRKKNKINITGV